MGNKDNKTATKTVTLPDYSSDADIVAHSLKVAKIRTNISYLALALAAIFGGGLFYKSIQPAPEPVVIEVDRLTGNAKIVRRASTYVSDTTLNNKYWVETFVTAYERYMYPMLEYDIGVVKALASDEVWDPYKKQYTGDYSKDKLLTNKEVHHVKIESTIEPSPGFATVTFVITKRNPAGDVIGVEKRIATVKYKYAPQVVQSEAAQTANPLGVVITGYRTDPVNMGAYKEVITETSPVIAAPVASPGAAK